MPEQPTHTFFNSRCAEYKTPFGAVPAGQTVTWRLTVPERLGYVDPHLVLTKDREDPVHYRMDFDGQTPGVNHFVFQLAPTHLLVSSPPAFHPFARYIGCLERI